MDKILDFIEGYATIRDFLIKGIDFLSYLATNTQGYYERLEINEIRIDLIIRLEILEETFEDDLAKVTSL